MCNAKGSAKFSGCGTTFSHKHSQCLITLTDGRSIDFWLTTLLKACISFPARINTFSDCA